MLLGDDETPPRRTGTGWPNGLRLRRRLHKTLDTTTHARTYPGSAVHPARASDRAFPCRASERPRPIQNGREETPDYSCRQHIDPVSGPIIPDGRTLRVPL